MEQKPDSFSMSRHTKKIRSGRIKMQTVITLTWCLFCAQYCFKHFIYPDSFSPHNNPVSRYYFFLINLFIYFWLLGLCFCVRAFSRCGERGPLFIAVRVPLTIVASLVAEHRLQMHRLSSCGSWAQLLRGMWDPPRPGLEPVSPALAGRFSTTAPPGKP